jgi:hypothetical protein
VFSTECFSKECVLLRMCSLKNVFSTERVLNRICSLQNFSLQNVFSKECVLYRLCSIQHRRRAAVQRGRQLSKFCMHIWADFAYDAHNSIAQECLLYRRRCSLQLGTTRTTAQKTISPVTYRCLQHAYFQTRYLYCNYTICTYTATDAVVPGRMRTQTQTQAQAHAAW